MKIIRSLVNLLFSALIVVSSVSCAPRTLVASTNTPEPAQTATPSASPTSTPSPEPTATPVASLSPVEQAAFLDQQFQDFLNKEGNYTQEKMAEMAIWGSQLCYEDGNGTDLGILKIFNEESKEDNRDLSAYGNLLTVTKDENNNIFLTMGFDGKDGNRFITELMVLGSVYDYYHNLPDGDPDKDRMGLWFATENGLHLDDKFVEKFRASSSDEVFNYLIGLKGKKIVADIPAKKINTSELTNGMKTMWDERNKRLPYTYNLISRLAKNGIDTSAIGSSGKDIILIDSSADLEAIDFNNVPIISGIRFRENG